MNVTNAILAAWASFLIPIIGSAIIPIVGKLDKRAADLFALLLSFLSAVATLLLLPHLLQPVALPYEGNLLWLETPIRINVGVLIDQLSIIMANVVAVVSFIIMVYCHGYMKGESSRLRFWMWMNTFIGSMLLLILSNNFLTLFVGWKLVGICSYGLIGYYYQDNRDYWIGGPAPNAFVKPSEAGLKALLVTGVGDMFMLAGIFIMYFYAGTLNFLELYDTAPIWLAEMAATPGMIILVSLLLLAGPMGKSAQFPFLEWLPEAMAGPGPVSALIHAATMVKSGVYLVARLVPFFYYGWWIAGIEEAAWFFYVTAWIGAGTALLAATQGIVAVELKKVLAYSTASQIGYMMLALGVSGFVPDLLVTGYTSSLFHLVNHAMFKACLFLAAGTVIHTVHSIYVHNMGNLRKFLPFTWGCTLVAAISLIGLPPFPGFWSKDAILLVTLEASPTLFVFGLITAALTAFYTIRVLGLVFHGQAADTVTEHLKHNDHDPDGHTSMKLATGSLAIIILGIGILGPFLEDFLRHSVAGVLPLGLTTIGAASTDSESSHGLVMGLSLICIAAGALPAYAIYIARTFTASALLERSFLLRKLQAICWNRWGFDHVYHRLFVDSAARLATLVAETIEAHWNQFLHFQLPKFLLQQAASGIQRLRTETDELRYNVSFVLALFFGLLLAMLFLNFSGN